MQTNTISAFCHIEKTGGTTIIQLLRARLGFSHVDLIPFANRSQIAAPGDVRYARLTNPFVKSVAGHSIRPYGQQWASSNLRFSALLRNPSERYVSDFFHFTRHMSFPNDFELWMSWVDRQNFQTSSIAGDGLIDLAIEDYKSGELLLGTLPNINNFASQLLLNCGISNSNNSVDLGVTNKGSQGKSSAQDYLERYEAEIRSKNESDWYLYSAVSDIEREKVNNLGVSEIGNDSESSQRDCTIPNKLWRNLIYKPASMQNPLRTHGLKDYIQFATWSPSQWRDFIENQDIS